MTIELNNNASFADQSVITGLQMRSNDVVAALMDNQHVLAKTKLTAREIRRANARLNEFGIYIRDNGDIAVHIIPGVYHNTMNEKAQASFDAICKSEEIKSENGFVVVIDAEFRRQVMFNMFMFDLQGYDQNRYMLDNIRKTICHVCAAFIMKIERANKKQGWK